VIEFNQVGKRFGERLAVDALSLQIAAGELVALIGTSGSGKSTTLKMINRLVEYDSGSIRFAGDDIRSFKPTELRRRMGYAIQSTGLFPHWNVERNIGTVPRLLNWPAARVRARVTELLELLHLEPGEFRDRYPHQLSGGQQQRVGVARALAGDPEVLLMDEPFGALDPLTRAALQDELARIHALSGCTIVLVTHDIDEALRLGQRIVLMDQGRIVQQGSPAELLNRPANDFVRDFVGRSDIGIKLLALETVGRYTRRGEQAAGTAIAAHLSLRAALSAFVAQRVDVLPVLDDAGQPLGALHFADLLKREPTP
jgi:osmoprotectant transport system ATP-binding protein